MNLWLWLSAPVVVLVALVSAAGVLVDATYAKETASWAAQGVGQDIINLVIACPALALTAYLAARGSFRAWLLWAGLLLYVIYSYVLYAFFVHFNAWFLAYVAILGLSVYALGGAVAMLDTAAVARSFASVRKTTAVSVYLMTTGVAFAALWLSDIVRATAAGTAPANVVELEMRVNPIHVLDLAFILPGMIVTSILLRRRRMAGLLTAVPLLTFGAVMGVAIIAMSRVMVARGLPGLSGMEFVMATMVGAAVWLMCTFLRDVRDFDNAAP